MKLTIQILILAIISLLFNGCATLFGPTVYTKHNAFRQVSSKSVNFPMDAQNESDLLQAMDHSLTYYATQELDKLVQVGDRTITIEEMAAAMQSARDQLAQTGLNESYYNYLKKHYDFYQPTSSHILFTAYCMPKLNGSWVETEKYRYPLYRAPDDLVSLKLSDFPAFRDNKIKPNTIRGRLTTERKIVPYFTREEIDFGNTLTGQGFELCWTDSIADNYFLQVEGSGIIQFEDGSNTKVTYAGQSGHAYHSIGKLLINEKKMTRASISIPGIKKYLNDNPNELKRILSSNPSYVFFKPSELGAVGNLDVPVTPFHSIAADWRLFPSGGLGFIEVEIPVFNGQNQIVGKEKLNRLVLVQDTGGAIRGPGRIDLFCGSGFHAENLAGHLKQNGSLSLLIKKK